MRSPCGVVLFCALSLAACGAATTRSGIDAGGGGGGGGQAAKAGIGGATPIGGASGNGASAASGGAPAGGGASGESDASASGGAGGAPLCDSNGDGLDDVASCLTAPGFLRLVNATSDQTFDVFVTGARNPVATGLAPFQVVTVGPVQVKLLDYEFRLTGSSDASPARPVSALTGETDLQAYGGTTLVGYLDPTSDAGTLATNAAPQPPVGACPSGAEVAIGDFTTLLPTPVIVSYAAGQGTGWTPAVSPGLAVGQIVDSSCWNAGPSIQFGAGPAGATTPTSKYQAVVFGSSLSYQLLLTDDRIIAIDSLDRVSYLPKQP